MSDDDWTDDDDDGAWMAYIAMYVIGIITGVFGVIAWQAVN